MVTKEMVKDFNNVLLEVIRKDEYTPNIFGKMLNRYIQFIGKKQKEFAEDIFLTPVEVSQFVRGHRPPNNVLFIRLEVHSRKMIKAETWFRIHQIELCHNLMMDIKTRKRETKCVVPLKIQLSLAF
jgi:plasmid maintenance system antidote protein VapI